MSSLTDGQPPTLIGVCLPLTLCAVLMTSQTCHARPDHTVMRHPCFLEYSVLRHSTALTWSGTSVSLSMARGGETGAKCSTHTSMHKRRRYSTLSSLKARIDYSGIYLQHPTISCITCDSEKPSASTRCCTDICLVWPGRLSFLSHTVLMLLLTETRTSKLLRMQSPPSLLVLFGAGYSTYFLSVCCTQVFPLFQFYFIIFPVVSMPWWFPGAGFKKEAQLEWVPHVRAALNVPYEAVKRQMARKPSSQ